MPFLITLITNLAGFFGLQLAKKTALAAAAIAASIALTLALTAAISALLTGIVATLPSTIAAGAYILPSNTSACIAAILGAKFARFVYDWNMKNLEIAASIN